MSEIFSYDLEAQASETQQVQRYDGAVNLTEGEEVALIQAHLAVAIERLESAPVGHLSEHRRQKRSNLIRELREYRSTAQFPKNTDFPGIRVPYFVDDRGTRCAMGYLLDISGHCEITNFVHQTQNFAKLKDLSDQPALIAWLDRHGMTAEEAALVQPSYDFLRPRPRPIITLPTRPGIDVGGDISLVGNDAPQAVQHGSRAVLKGRVENREQLVGFDGMAPGGSWLVLDIPLLVEKLPNNSLGAASFEATEVKLRGTFEAGATVRLAGEVFLRTYGGVETPATGYLEVRNPVVVPEGMKRGKSA